MAQLPRDQNFTTVSGAVSASSDSAASIRALQYDAGTRGLTIHIVGDDVGIGGGTQYTEGATDASITGNVIMWEDTSDTLRAVSVVKPLPTVNEKASSAGTSAGVSVGSGSTTVLAANSARKAAIIVNDSDETVYLKYGTTAVANSGIRLNAQGGSVVETVYTGIITGISASGGKVVTVTEM